MGLALGCPLDLAGACETRDWPVDQQRVYFVLPDFDFDAELSGFGCPPI